MQKLQHPETDFSKWTNVSNIAKLTKFSCNIFGVQHSHTVVQTSISCNRKAFKRSNAGLAVTVAAKLISHCVLKVEMTFCLFHDAEARASKITNFIEASQCCRCTLLVQSAHFTYFQIWSKSRENRAKIKKSCVRRRFSQRRVDEIGRELLFWRNLFWVVLASVQRPRDQNTSAAGLCL